MSEIVFGNDEKWFNSFLQHEGPKYIFGCGQQAINVRFLLHLMRKNGLIDGFIVSKPKQRSFYEYRVMAVTEVSRADDAVVLMAVSETVAAKIANSICDRGFKTVFVCTDWENANDLAKERVFCEFLTSRNVNIDTHVLSFGNTRLINPLKEKRVYRQMLMGTTFHDIIVPWIMKDNVYNNTERGDWLDKKILETDVVADVGSCAGVFSAFAASFGKYVISFEPAHSILPYLKRNADLYEKFDVEQMAVGDRTEEVTYYDRTDYPKYSGTDYLDGAEQYEVKMITLDEWCWNRQVYPGLIKADIEGHTISILNGTSMLIKKYKPTFFLSCSDDEKDRVLILLQAEGYRIYTVGKWIIATYSAEKLL